MFPKRNILLIGVIVVASIHLFAAISPESSLRKPPKNDDLLLQNIRGGKSQSSNVRVHVDGGSQSSEVAYRRPHIFGSVLSLSRRILSASRNDGIESLEEEIVEEEFIEYQRRALPQSAIAWPMLMAFGYYVAIALSIPNVPKLVNELISETGAVSGKSASFYGLMGGLDQIFTCLFAAFSGSMSDRYGRKLFMAMSATGLGISYLLTASSRAAWPLLLGAILDGTTSCMYPVAQAYISDVLEDRSKLAETYGLFQGIAVGLSMLVGVLAGGLLGKKYGHRVPVYLSGVVCFVTAISVLLFVPESVPERSIVTVTAKKTKSTQIQTQAQTETQPLLKLPKSGQQKLTGTGTTTTTTRVSKRTASSGTSSGSKGTHGGSSASWAPYNPIRALSVLGRSRAVSLVTCAYVFIWMAQAGLQVNWINFTEKRLGWDGAASSKSLAFMGLVAAISPRLLIPRLGTHNAMRYGALLLSLSNLALSVCSDTWMVYAFLPGISLGAVCFPATLGYMTSAVDKEDAGSMQGALETVKTLTTAISYPLMAAIFGFWISDRAPLVFPGGAMVVGSVLTLVAYILLECARRASSQGPATTVTASTTATATTTSSVAPKTKGSSSSGSRGDGSSPSRAHRAPIAGEAKR